MANETCDSNSNSSGNDYVKLHNQYQALKHQTDRASRACSVALGRDPNEQLPVALSVERLVDVLTTARQLNDLLRVDIEEKRRKFEKQVQYVKTLELANEKYLDNVEGLKGDVHHIDSRLVTAQENLTRTTNSLLRSYARYDLLETELDEYKSAFRLMEEDFHALTEELEEIKTAHGKGVSTYVTHQDGNDVLHHDTSRDDHGQFGG